MPEALSGACHAPPEASLVTLAALLLGFGVVMSGAFFLGVQLAKWGER